MVSCSCSNGEKSVIGRAALIEGAGKYLLLPLSETHVLCQIACLVWLLEEQGMRDRDIRGYPHGHYALL